MRFFNILTDKLDDVDVEYWSFEVENYENLSLDLLQKILSEGENYFDSTVADNEQITSKSYTILSILITLLGVFIAFLISQVGQSIGFHEKAVMLLLIVVIFVCSYCLLILMTLIFPTRMMVSGDQPKPIDFSSIAALEKKDQLFTFVFNSIETIQGKIDFNNEVHRRRIARLEEVVKISAVTFVLALAILLFIYFKS